MQATQKRPAIVVENDGVLGHDTRVYVVRKDENGDDERIDISKCCRALDLNIAAGEVNTARLEVFVTGVKVRAEVENVVIEDLKPPRRWWFKRMAEVTTFNRDGLREFVKARS